MGEQQETGAAGQEPAELFQGTAMEGQAFAFGDRPAEPGRREAEGRDGRKNQDLVARHGTRQRDANAIMHGIAGRQHGNGPSAPAQDLFDRQPQRRRPGRSLCSDGFWQHGEVPLAADNQLGRLDQTAAQCRQFRPAALAQPEIESQRFRPRPRQ